LVECQLPKQETHLITDSESDSCDSAIEAVGKSAGSPLQKQPISDDLARLAELWPSLPEQIRAIIINIAEAQAKGNVMLHRFMAPFGIRVKNIPFGRNGK